MTKIKNLIKLNEYTNTIPLPKLRLMTRAFEPIGNITHYTEWRVSIRGSELDEISFEVTKYVNGVLNPIWDSLVDLKIVSVLNDQDVECGKFEIQVSYTDESKTTKSIQGVSLETELGQLILHDFHVNDDFVAEVEQGEEIIPTVLFNPEDKEHSLLHRVLADKARHWEIDGEKCTKYVVADEEYGSESVTEFQREYTVDGTSIYDFLTGEVAKDANIVFQFDSDTRKLWFESLVDFEPTEEHPARVTAIGKDTTILVSKRKLGNQITINSNKDNVKNCFRVEGGDDLMTSQVAVVNMTGTNYIYQFADFQLNDMPTELKEAILSYQEWINSSELQEEYYGENGLYTQYVEANDRYYELKDSMAPSIHTDPPETARAQWEELKTAIEANDMYIGVSDLTLYDSSRYQGVINNIEAMLKVWCDSRYKVEVLKEPVSEYNPTTKIWTGYVRVTRYSETTKFYPTDADIAQYGASLKYTVKINADSPTNLYYTRQKIDIALAKGEMWRVDKEFNDETTVEEMLEYFDEWNLTKLKSFQTGYDTCKSVLQEGTTIKADVTREIAEDLLQVYTTRLSCVNQIIEKREAEIAEQQKVLDEMIGYVEYDDDGNVVKESKGKIQDFQESLAFEKYLKDLYGDTEGERYYKNYQSYIREDSYQNSNYISDTLESTAELTAKAEELLHQAEREIKKACVLQRTMSVNLNNLLAIPEFKPLYDDFDLFNYIRIRTEDEILKLRLIGVDYSGDSMATIEVTFSDQIETVDGNISDLQSVLDQAKSIATSYSSTISKANQGSSAQYYVSEVIENGLNAAATMLKSSDDNEIEITSAGILCKRMDDEGIYGDKQLRIIGNGIYMTETAWGEHPRQGLPDVSMAIGEILFTDPISQETNWRYGVIADAIVGKILVGNQLYISNSTDDANATVIINENGIEIGGGYLHINNSEDGRSVIIDPDEEDPNNISGYIFRITDEDGNTTIGANSNGYAEFSGAITVGSVPSSSTTGFTVSQNGAMSASNATIYGSINAQDGNIGGWTITSTGLKKEDSSTDYMLLDGTNKSIVSVNGNDKLVLASAYLKFYVSNSPYLTMQVGKWSGTNTRGVSLNSEFNSKYISFGNMDSASATSYTTPFLLNYGLNPDGYTQKVQIYDDALFRSKLYFESGFYFNLLSSSGTRIGITTNGVFGATKLTIGTTYYSSYTASIDGTLYASGAIQSASSLIIGSTSYSGYVASITGKMYVSGGITASLTGNVTGNCTGSSGSCTGNAATATSALSATDAYYLDSGQTHYCYISSGNNLIPDERDAMNCGGPTNRWNNVYAKNTTIQTSDRNEKNSIVDVSKEYENMFFNLRPVSYKYNNGDRTHIGYISQEVEDAMTKSNLTDMDFAGFCKDLDVEILVDKEKKTEKIIQKTDEDGNPAYIYSLRYGEFIALNTHMIQKLYKRVEELETELASLKKK